MSYHPGILMCMFYFRKRLAPNHQTAKGEALTAVMGIVGALGNMKATSSNFPRRRQFSASGILSRIRSALLSIGR